MRVLANVPTSEALTLLRHTNARVRNQAAIELADRPNAPEIFDGLVACIRDPLTKGSRGTIVYALWEAGYDCASILLDLADCYLTGSYEEAVHASDIVLKMAENLPDTADEFRARLRAYNEGGWRAEAIDEILRELR